MHIYLSTAKIALLFFLLFAPLSILPFVIYHYKKYGHIGGKRSLVIYAFVLFAITAFLMTILPLPQVTEDFCTIRRANTIPNFEFFRFVREIFEELHGNISLAGILKSRTFMVTAFNVLLLLPLGFFLRYLFKMKFWQALAIGFATTLFFEITQLTGIFGIYDCPYRLFEVDDLMTNTFGVALGFWLFDYVHFLPDIEIHKIELQRNANLTQRCLLLSIDYLLVSFVAENLIIPNNSGHLAHLLWSLGLYSAYFILLPMTRLRNTIAGRLLSLKVVQENNSLADAKSLLILYGVLILSPQIISDLSKLLVETQYNNGIYALAGLLLLSVWFIATFGLIALRKDRRGLHNILSKTKVVCLRRRP